MTFGGIFFYVLSIPGAPVHFNYFNISGIYRLRDLISPKIFITWFLSDIIDLSRWELNTAERPSVNVFLETWTIAINHMKMQRFCAKHEVTASVGRRHSRQHWPWQMCERTTSSVFSWLTGRRVDRRVKGQQQAHISESCRRPAAWLRLFFYSGEQKSR